MSTEAHSAVRCPHCRTPLTLSTADGKSVAQPVREEWSPPPVKEVLAVYGDRVKDASVAARGAARVRESMARARRAAAQRRAAQSMRSRPSRSA
ncbi:MULTISPECIES: hypothetical protein [Thermomonospora]|uniref:Uncharacterized protein n=1 Tax=Thermomonospora curvata (strain ATCC 19995 / DSM 43183 / JCM 3096 / KCTC 9072 / NBRC 15933 / NCIMB 10081 / Henssen B9) TaxID=471852 RepID=D1ADC6_THECD|nr:MULTISPECIES: hypothetical protein [Thermomonospora]ACY95636.1 hypothetical protein Tcur_0028 [Thermomonospora curvata DSM 43183]PKK16235.1 MAG: hypothetical protein BUE48_000130 [Thermomonospora sp. CIF 1]